MSHCNEDEDDDDDEEVSISKLMASNSYLGDFYKHPQYAFGTNEAKTFLAGSYQFQLDEIEVYEKWERESSY